MGATVDQPGPDPRERSDALGIRLIVRYKFVKAVVELLLGVLLLVLVMAGLAANLRTVALNIRDHMVEDWSIALAERALRVVTEPHLLVVALASFLDGVISAAEGWVLHRRYWWSRWLVVGATSCLVPFEGVALVRHFSPVRLALLLLNAVVVVYLIRRRVVPK